MSESTEEKARARSIGTQTIVAWTGAACFAISTLWFALVAYHITVPAPPNTNGLSAEVAARLWWGDWFGEVLGQERFYVAIACVAFVCTAIVGGGLKDRLGSEATIGASLLWFGSSMWIFGNVLLLGGHRAVGLMATHPGNPIDTTNSIAFTVDLINDALEQGAFALLALGVVALGRAALSRGAVRWGQGSIAAGSLLGIISLVYAAGPEALVHALLIVGGVIVLPIWLVSGVRASFGEGSMD